MGIVQHCSKKTHKMKKLTEKQITDLKWLEDKIYGNEIPYDDPEGYPYLLIGNSEFIKENLEQAVEDALARGESEIADALDEVVEYLKEIEI